MIMTKDAALDYLHRGKMLVASIPSSGPDYLAWVGVYPLDTARETSRRLFSNYKQPLPLPGVRAYRIRRFEVNRTLIEQDVSIAEPELEKKENYFAYGDDDLGEKLRQLGVRFDQLMRTYNSDYPI